MAKIAWMNYGANPNQFIRPHKELRLDTLTA
jgi:hypothetical protein